MKCKLLTGLVTVGLLTWGMNAQAQEKIWVPEVDGEWWQIADDNPDVTPFQIVDDIPTNTCDFTIWQDDENMWHTVACIRGTDAPGQRVFHHWKTAQITDTQWEPQGLFEVHRGTRAGKEASVQAPHAFRHDGQHHMFYNSGNAYAMVSPDGVNWTQNKNQAGELQFFVMGRDVCIFRDEPANRWIGYYCGGAQGQEGHVMAYRTAQELDGEWSDPPLSARNVGNPESPYVLYHKNKYYLWQQMSVYVSDDPTDFNGDVIAHMTGIWYDGKWAPEIIQDKEGQFYLAGYGRGLWIAKLKWVEKTEEEIGQWREEWTQYLAENRPKKK